MNMRIHLTGLADLANARLANRGQPLMLSLDDILPDPDNPRIADEGDSAAALEAQEQLDADVALRGVKTPISVRAHPTVPGKYIINYGHRRYKSACSNKLSAIPAFIDEMFDSYDQVNENELRTGLTTRARALFIKRRLDAGDGKGEIAERLRKKNQTFITEHLALIDAPACVDEAYAAGITSARTLYDLRQAWQEFPAEFEAWCRSGVTISRDGIREALAGFRHDEAAAAARQGTDTDETRQPDFRHDETTATASKCTGEEEARQPDLCHDENGMAGLLCEMPTFLDQSSGLESSRTADAGALEKRPTARMEQGSVPRSSSRASTSGPAPQRAATADIVVRYKGQLARVDAEAVVSIVLDRTGKTLNVRLSELAFGA